MSARPLSGRRLFRALLRVAPRILAAACIGLIVLLCVLSASPDAHRMLHHDADDGDHACAVTLFAHGLTTAASGAPLAEVIPVTISSPVAIHRRPDLRAPHYAHLPVRGPPGA